MKKNEKVLKIYESLEFYPDDYDEFFEEHGGTLDAAFAAALDDYTREAGILAQFVFPDGSKLLFDSVDSHNSDGILPPIVKIPEEKQAKDIKELIKKIRENGTMKIGTGEYQCFSYPSELAKAWMDGKLKNADLPGEMKFTRVQGSTYLIAPIVKQEFDIVKHKSRKDEADVLGDAPVVGIGDMLEGSGANQKTERDAEDLPF